MKKILVLEDEASIRSFIVINLRRAGYDVIEAETGEEALERLRANPDIHPEIVTYQGGDLPLKKAGSLKVKDFPFLERYIGDRKSTRLNSSH